MGKRSSPNEKKGVTKLSTKTKKKTDTSLVDVVLVGLETEENLGLRSIAAFLKKNNVKVDIEPYELGCVLRSREHHLVLVLDGLPVISVYDKVRSSGPVCYLQGYDTGIGYYDGSGIDPER